MKHVLIGSVCLLLLAAGCSKDKDGAAKPAPTSDASSSAVPTESATPTIEAPDPDAPAIDYETSEDSGKVVTAPSDASGLSKASDDFKAFISAELNRLQNEAGGDCPEKPTIRVNRLQNAGWASGGVTVPECGGYAVLWAKQGGEWSQVWGGQELVECTTLVRYKFPVAVAGDQCLSQEGSASTYRG
ncbi:MAG: hypothetical protein WBQ48_02505 [Aeromicrobium sp.]